MTRTTPAPAQHALDEQAVRAVLEAYSDAVNRRDYDRYADFWAEDGVWDLAAPINGHHVGRDAITAEVRATIENLGFFVQMPHAVVVAVDGDTARARVTLNEIGGEGADGGPFSSMNILAMYDDELRREADGRWRFTLRSYRVIHFSTEVPAGQSWPAPFTASTF